MSGDGPLQEPPLPRYRLQHSTGRWRKELSPQLLYAAPTDSVAAGATGASASGAATDKPQPFESSYDYFLRRSYAVEHSTTRQERVQRQAGETQSQIRTFEEAHLPTSATAYGAPGQESSDDEEETLSYNSTRNGNSKAVGDSAGPRSLQRSSLPSGAGAAVPAEAGGSHPLIGYLNRVPLSRTYAVLCELKGFVVPLGREEQMRSQELSASEFHQLLARTGDCSVLSADYETRMMRSFSFYRPATDTLPTFSLFSFVVDHTFHPRLDNNVRMLFRAFDVEKRGVVPTEALHPRVVAAWAEVNAFGSVRDAWLKLSNALGNSDEIGRQVFNLETTFLTEAAVRVILCSSEDLFSVANTVDMEGGR